MHDDEGECYENECVCECLSGKFTIHFKTIFGLNQEYYTFESVMTFFMNKHDRKNLKMFIYILKNPEKIYDITEKSKQKIGTRRRPRTPRATRPPIAARRTLLASTTRTATATASTAERGE